MKNRFKKLLALLMAMSMLALLAACGGSGTADPGPDTAPAANQPDADNSSPEPDAALPAIRDTINVALTSEGAVYDFRDI